MRKRALQLTAFAALVFGTQAAFELSAMSPQPIPEPVANIWSAPLNQLSGRLRVEFEDLKPGLRHAVYAELRNHSLNPIAVTNQPRVHAELFDASGNPMTPAGFSMSGPIPQPQWAVIPRDAYLGFRIDNQIVGLPTREHGMALLAVGNKSWGLGAGKYVLKVNLVFKKEEYAPPNQWVGELELPPVEVVITAEMLAVN